MLRSSTPAIVKYWETSNRIRERRRQTLSCWFSNNDSTNPIQTDQIQGEVGHCAEASAERPFAREIYVPDLRILRRVSGLHAGDGHPATRSVSELRIARAPSRAVADDDRTPKRNRFQKTARAAHGAGKIHIGAPAAAVPFVRYRRY